MVDKYYFLAFGELCLDIMYDNNIVREIGGISAFNALYNLGLFGEQAYAVGIVGNDENGKKALQSLRNGNVNIDNVEIQNKRTNVFHIIMNQNQTDESSIISESSPLSNKTSYELSQTIKTELPEQFEDTNIILIISNFEKTTRKFIESAKNKCRSVVVSLDITKSKIFSEVSAEYLEEFFGNVNLIQINQRYLSVLYEKLGIYSDEEFTKKFGLELLTITKGTEGAKFLFPNNGLIETLEKKPITVRKIKDPTGAGDAFHGMMLKAYHRNLIQGKTINSEFLNKSFTFANKLAGRVVTIIGARGTIEIVQGIESKQEDSIDDMVID